MNRRSFSLALLALSLIVSAAFYPLGAQAANGHTAKPVDPSKPIIFAHSLERHQEILDLARLRENGKYRGPSFVRNNSPETVNAPNTILFTFSESDLSPGPGFTDNTRQTTHMQQLHVSRVEIAFAHEGWRLLHPLQKTSKRMQDAAESENAEQSPVFFLYFDLDRNVQQSLNAAGKPLEYRYIVDGIWMADPANSLSVRKMNGTMVSQLDLSTAPAPSIISPEIVMPMPSQSSKILHGRPEDATLAAMASSRQARTAIIRWVGESGQTIYVGGTFNQFDPYMSPMEAVGPSPRNPQKTVYELKVRLLAGQYYYHFVINGNNYLDPLNSQHGHGPEGRTYSQLQIP